MKDAAENLTQTQAAEKLKALSKQVNHLNYLYYQKSISEVSDYEFDKMLRELESLEAQFPELRDPNSPTQRVGGTITKNFKPVKHKHPMLSLGNTYSEQELRDFDQRVKKGLGTEAVEFVCEQKFDGVAISLTYKNGELVLGATRGDGNRGDDITPNIRTINSLPLQLQPGNYPEEFEVRGEVFMSTKVFERLNAEREDIGESALANPRNAASGTLKLQDSAEVARRSLDCYCYSFLADSLHFETHSESLQALKKWGFPVSDSYKLCVDIEEALSYIKTWEEKRFELPVATDGVVVKVNSYIYQQELGLTAKNPRWAIAYKYTAASATTILKDILYQVGRTGAVTPVAVLEPVPLAGTVVKRASVHNANEIARLDLRINDTVSVEKGGEIIPKITGVDLTKRDEKSVPVVYPEICPVCHTGLIRKEGEANHYCPNEKGCPPQLKSKIEHFISRKALNIEGLGPETIEQFFQHDLVRTPADLYDLTFEQLVTLDRMGEKSANNLLQSLQKSKEIPYERVLFGLGIRFVGNTVAQKLAIAFPTIELLQQANNEQLIAVPEIGDRIAESVIDFFTDEDNLKEIERLQTAGLQFVSTYKPVEQQGEQLTEKTFVISGVFKDHSREELQQLIVSHGGKMVSSISAKLNYLVAGDKMGPAKLEKATKLKIPIITEEELIKMIGKA